MGKSLVSCFSDSRCSSFTGTYWHLCKKQPEKTNHETCVCKQTAMASQSQAVAMCQSSKHFLVVNICTICAHVNAAFRQLTLTFCHYYHKPQNKMKYSVVTVTNDMT